MTKIIIYAAIALAVVGGFWGYLEKLKHDAEQAGINKQIAADIAKANQNIADRRKTDAQFDKLDAAAVCKQFNLEWVFIDGKSECH